MTYGLYSLRDACTGFLNISLDNNNQTATRNFAHAAKNTDSLFFTNPSDYTLYKLGEFESDTGSITLLEIPERVVCADQLNRKE